MGYHDGYKEGFNKALGTFQKELEMIHLCKPIKVIVTTEELERLKNENGTA